MAVAAALSACGGEPGALGQESAADAMAAQELTTNQSSSDVTVLSAEAIDVIGGNGSPPFDTSGCDARPDGAFDCTAKLEGHIGAPALQELVLRSSSSSSFFCRVLRVTTVSRSAALANADGIGFFYSGYGTSTRFVPRAALKKLQDITLRDGSAAELHEFAGVANCWLGSSSSSMFASYEFKPFMRFTTPSGDEYFNWDQVERNYRVSPMSTSFDRRAELLPFVP